MTDSRELPGLDKKPGKSNWVDAAGGLPSYIDRIARHLHAEKGMTISHAIATAISQCRKWAGDPDTAPTVRAQATAALAQWDGMKVAARAKRQEKGNGHPPSATGRR